ncbi:hypothetical protein [Tomitella cavernea]|nr:hypothetical protein [Tomitella cavernea]
MSRLMAAWDRIATAVVGLSAVAGGLVLIGWATHWPPRWTDWLPDRVSIDAITDVTGQSWWPWAAGIGGVLIGLLALRWLLGHIPVPRRDTIRLPGTGPEGRLTASVRTLADGAAAALAADPAIGAAHARIRRDRGTLTVDVTAQLAAPADLPAAARAAARTRAELADMFGDTAPPTRIHLHTGRRRGQTRLVR